MSTTITLGFQSSSGTSPVVFFNLAIPKDGHKHQVANLLDKATNGGNPVKVPADFQVSEILVEDPGHFSKDDKVEVEYPSGGHRVTVDLNQNKTDVKIAAAAKEIAVTASK